MLSLSADLSNKDVDLAVINGDGGGGVPHGEALMQFAEALASRDEDALAAARQQLLETAGSEVLVDAAGVAANFQRMVRIADSTGIPVDDMMGAISVGVQDELDLRRFHSARNTPTRSMLRRLLDLPVRLMAKRVMRAGDRRVRARKS